MPEKSKGREMIKFFAFAVLFVFAAAAVIGFTVRILFWAIGK